MVQSSANRSSCIRVCATLVLARRHLRLKNPQSGWYSMYIPASSLARCLSYLHPPSDSWWNRHCCLYVGSPMLLQDCFGKYTSNCNIHNNKEIGLLVEKCICGFLSYQVGFVFYWQVTADYSWAQSQNRTSCSERMDRMITPNQSVNSEAELSYSSDRHSSMKVADAIEMLLKKSVESPSQQAENTYL